MDSYRGGPKSERQDSHCNVNETQAAEPSVVSMLRP